MVWRLWVSDRFEGAESPVLQAPLDAENNEYQEELDTDHYGQELVVGLWFGGVVLHYNSIIKFAYLCFLQRKSLENTYGGRFCGEIAIHLFS